MTSLLQRLLRHRSPISLASLTNRHNPQYQTLAPSILTHSSQSIDSRLKSILPSPPPKDESNKPEVKYDFVYPSFSYGLVVNPVFQKVVKESEKEEGGVGLEKMWADSTKKKRKRKMNKRKYKKLMKRMRNK